MFYDITPEELLSVQRYLDGEDAEVLFSDAPVKLLNMTDALRRKLLTELRNARKENARLRRQVARLQKRDEQRTEMGEFPLLEFDSIEVAAALCDVLNGAGIKTSRTMVNYMLFDVYANWLYSSRQRLFVERPVAQEWGPCFWRVIKNPEKLTANGAFASLAARNTGVAALVRNVARKYALWDETLMRQRLVSCDPYVRAHKDKNCGKWNKPLSDSDIWHWMNTRYTG